MCKTFKQVASAGLECFRDKSWSILKLQSLVAEALPTHTVAPLSRAEKPEVLA